jgi:hypothetical protein
MQPQQPLLFIHRWTNAALDAGLDPASTVILLHLARHADYEHGTGCRPSLARLIEKTGVSRATLLRRLADLERAGWIAREGGSTGAATLYALTIPAAPNPSHGGTTTRLTVTPPDDATRLTVSDTRLTVTQTRLTVSPYHMFDHMSDHLDHVSPCERASACVSGQVGADMIPIGDLDASAVMDVFKDQGRTISEDRAQDVAGAFLSHSAGAVATLALATGLKSLKAAISDAGAATIAIRSAGQWVRAQKAASQPAAPKLPKRAAGQRAAQGTSIYADPVVTAWAATIVR